MAMKTNLILRDAQSLHFNVQYVLFYLRKEGNIFEKWDKEYKRKMNE